MRKKCAVVAILFCMAAAPSAWAEKRDLEDNNLPAYLQLFNQVLEKLQSGYYDTEKIKPGMLIRAAIDGMLDSLDDPYTRLMVPEDYKDMKIKTEGKFGGVGMVIEKEDTAIRVVYPISGTPAFAINDYYVSGAQPLSKFKRIVEKALGPYEAPAAGTKVMKVGAP